jgi:hypothetical protein
MLLKFGYESFLPNTINRFMNYSRVRYGNHIKLRKLGIGNLLLIKKAVFQQDMHQFKNI